MKITEVEDLKGDNRNGESKSKVEIDVGDLKADCRSRGPKSRL